MSNKVRYSGKSFKYYIEVKDGHVIRPLCIMLLQMTFMIKDNVLEMQNDIWDETRDLINEEFDRKPIYDNKYIKTMVKSFDRVMHTNLHNSGVPKVGLNCVCLFITKIDSIVKIDTIYYEV